MFTGARNIPIDQMRERMSELPKDKPIIVYCGVGIRGYNVVRMLKQNGYDAYNVPGGWKTYGREGREKVEERDNAQIRTEPETSKGAIPSCLVKLFARQAG
eukprot:50888-Hanusia_phi.AAC.1